MRLLQSVFDANAAWAERVRESDPAFFDRLAAQQRPEYLWIGCADSRVPANTIMGLDPGDVFVHRNVANLVVHTDLNMLAVLQYAVEVLQVRHVIVCGHYGCGGVQAAMGHDRLGVIDNWLLQIKDLFHKHKARIDRLDEPERQLDLLCELNVREQVYNVCHAPIVQEAWARGQDLAVHGWIYGLKDGLLKDLDVCVSEPGQLADVYRVEL